MKNDPYFASIAVQMLEGRGYCCLGQSDNALLLFAPNPKLVGTSMWALKNTIPGMYNLLWTHVSTGVKATAGTYDWQDPDGSIKMKYGYFLDLEEEMIYDGKPTGELVFVATAYLDDFSEPAEAVEESINSSMEATTANIDSKTDSVTTRNVIIVVAIAVLAAVVAFFVARSVTKPVRQLTAVADKISKGDLDVTIDVKSKDEIGDLANSFERMVAAVRFLSQDQEKGDKQ